MTDITLVLSDFRLQFPAFTSSVTYPDAQITMYFGMASDYISVTNYGLLVNGSRTLALYLLTAHLLQISVNFLNNKPAGTITSATEGSVSISLMQPQARNEWQFWLNQTGYGQQLLALIRVKAAFGFYTAGSYSSGNIRKYNGNF